MRFFDRTLYGLHFADIIALTMAFLALAINKANESEPFDLVIQMLITIAIVCKILIIYKSATGNVNNTTRQLEVMDRQIQSLRRDIDRLTITPRVRYVAPAA